MRSTHLFWPQRFTQWVPVSNAESKHDFTLFTWRSSFKACSHYEAVWISASGSNWRREYNFIYEATVEGRVSKHLRVSWSLNVSSLWFYYLKAPAFSLGRDDCNASTFSTTVFHPGLSYVSWWRRWREEDVNTSCFSVCLTLAWHTHTRVLLLFLAKPRPNLSADFKPWLILNKRDFLGRPWHVFNVWSKDLKTCLRPSGDSNQFLQQLFASWLKSSCCADECNFHIVHVHNM